MELGLGPLQPQAQFRWGPHSLQFYQRNALAQGPAPGRPAVPGRRRGCGCGHPGHAGTGSGPAGPENGPSGSSSDSDFQSPQRPSVSSTSPTRGEVDGADFSESPTWSPSPASPSALPLSSLGLFRSLTGWSRAARSPCRRASVLDDVRLSFLHTFHGWTAHCRCVDVPQLTESSVKHILVASNFRQL